MKKLILIIIILFSFSFSKAQTYNSIKSYIDAYVNTNGTNAITGAIMNVALTDLLEYNKYMTFDITRDYIIGDICLYSNDLYEFTSNHSAGAWNAGDVSILTGAITPDSSWVKGDFDTLYINDGSGGTLDLYYDAVDGYFNYISDDNNLYFEGADGEYLLLSDGLYISTTSITFDEDQTNGGTLSIRNPLSASTVWTLPDSSGTIALLSNIPDIQDSSWVIGDFDTLQINADVGNTLDIMWNNSSVYDFVSSGSYNIRFDAPGFLTTNVGQFIFNDGGTSESLLFLNDTVGFTTTSLLLAGSGFNTKVTSRATTNKEIFFPDSSGTIALLSNIPSVTTYWQRASTTISPLTAGDNISTTGYVNGGIYYLDGSIFADLDGSDNLMLGSNNLTALTTGNDNVAFGGGALAANTTGDYNVSIGNSSMLLNTTGNDNVALGTFALGLNIVGTKNIAVGYASLYNNTASNNIAFGYNSLRNNTSGTPNVAIGGSALYTNIIGASNLAIGYQSLFANTSSFNIAIGDQSLKTNTTGQQNIAIGYECMNLNLTGSYNTAIGLRALQYNTASYNLGIGFNALRLNTSGEHNLGIGYQVLYSNQTGARNTAIGYQSLYNNTANDNVGIGYRALRSNTTGYYNIGIGYDALYTNQTGRGNTAIGANALKVATAGYNTAIGYASQIRTTTGTGNMAIGYYSMLYNTTGSYNLALGNGALYTQTTASYNTALGYEAGYSNVTGDGNVFIGYQAGYNETGSNKLYIDNSNTTTPLIYGEFDNDYIVLNTDTTQVEGYLFKQNTPHLFRYFGDSTVTFSFASSDTWYELTNASNDLWIDEELELFTENNDTIIFGKTGDFDFAAHITFKGSNSQVYVMRYYNVTQAAPIPTSAATTGDGTGDFVQIVVSAYASVNKGDKIIMQMKNASGTGDATLKNSTQKIYYIHD